VWWLDRLGILDRTLADMPEPRQARREPSLQLVGGDGGGERGGADGAAAADLDLSVLQREGVALAGHLVAADGARVRFAADLPQVVAEADRRMTGVLDRIDRHVAAHGLEARYPADARPAPVALAGPGPGELDLAAAGVASVLWATGYRRVYPWLHAPVLDAEGEIRHQRGRTPLPGLYVLGLQFLIRRRSSFLGGVGRDAAEIADHIAVRTAPAPLRLPAAA
jgi:putative flavoprotein involved in K+ transport